MVIRRNKQLHLWHTRLFKRGSKVNVTMHLSHRHKSFVRSSATMSTPTKENDDAMAENTSTAVDVVASTRVKTPSSVRKVSSFVRIVLN